ncbi:MAG: hypothetical protein ACTIM4_13535 [Marinomonas sp.]|uniref:hypothetical protein n=1 Tax=Marinomonas sp. TaxID=1904862 RepID=UPI003F9CEB8A
MLEQKFREFKEKHTAKEFNNAAFLKKQADEIRAQDAALADRIMLRVRNLKKQQAAKASAAKQEAVKAPEKAVQPEKAVDHIKPAVKREVKPALKSKPVEKAPKLTKKQKVHRFSKTPFALCVVLPTLLFAIYQLFWATDRFESQAQVIVQQPDSTATLDASMALLSGLGVGGGSSGSDPQLVEAYINSNDMLAYLDKMLGLKKHYSESEADIFSRLASDATQEKFLEFYQKHIHIELNEASGVISVSAQAFNAEFAEKLTNAIVARSEWYINNIGHQLAEAQLTFIKGEYQLYEDNLKKAQVTLLNFQQEYHLLDPAAEGLAMQQIAYGIEGQIASKEAELKGLTSIMSNHAPKVKAMQNELGALREQLIKERNKLSKDGGKTISVSEILAKYTDLKIAMELALQSYTSSKVSLEKSRIEAYKQIKYLITVQAATAPENSSYPNAPYNISLFALLAAMFFGVIRIVYSIVHELK